MSAWLRRTALPVVTGGRQELGLAVASVVRVVETLAGESKGDICSWRMGGA